MAVLFAFKAWTQFISSEHSLVSLAQPLLLSTVLALLGVFVARLLARGLNHLHPRGAFDWRRLAFAHRGWCFGLPSLILAALLLRNFSTEQVINPTWSPLLIDAGVAMLVVMAYSVCRAPPSAMPGAARLVNSRWTPLAACLVLSVGVLIGGDTWQTLATPWKPYLYSEAWPPYGKALGYYDSFVSVPKTQVWTRYTRTRREVELVQGTAFFNTDYHPEFDAAHWPALLVRAGEARIIVAPGTGGDCSVTAFQVEREGNRVEVLAYVGNSVSLDVPDAHGPGAVSGRVWLKPGERAVLEGSTLSVHLLSEAEQRRLVSWTEARLLFEGEPLAEVIKHVNAFAARPFVIADPRIESLPVRGDFVTDRPRLAERVLAELERQGVARAAPADPLSPNAGIRLVGYDKSPSSRAEPRSDQRSNQTVAQQTPIGTEPIRS